MADFTGKTALIFGIANHNSVAWPIAQQLAEQGARLAVTYQGRMEQNVRKLAATLPGDPLVLPCDVQDDAQLDAVFSQVGSELGGLDILLHSVAYAPTDDLKGRVADVSRQGFLTAVDISAFSLIAMARRAEPLMQPRGGGSVLAMTYLGSERVIPGYNLMGIAKAALEAAIRYLAYDLGAAGVRVNGISAGPMRTLSARGVGHISDAMDMMNVTAPLRRNMDQSDVADLALFLFSDHAKNITGNIEYVDSGFHIMGLGSL
ncbi:MAG: enoyl-ACP reductase [Ktedonobacterales bacterium]